jgi:hypothetical protein
VDPGSVVSVRVAAANGVGASAPVDSNTVVATHRCPLACLVVDATDRGPAEMRLASGFLHAVGAKTLPPASPVLAALAPLHWRVATSWNMEDTAAGGQRGVDLTELLSDDWWASHNVAGRAVPPWWNWSEYSSWVTAAVRVIEAQGKLHGFSVRYWEVQNEPMDSHYDLGSLVPGGRETVAEAEQQYLVAYRAIKAADPSARVLAPSLMSWAANRAEANGMLDMRTFLDFAVLNGVAPDAIAFHDNLYGPLPDEFAPNHGPMQPSELETAVGQLRAMIAGRPSLGHPDILINEYGDPNTSGLPGWDVGRMAAIERSGVTEANRSCWGTCSDGALDGLLTGDGRTTLPGYWVYAFYATLSGNQVPVTSTFTDVTGLATVERSGAIQVLVGRHQGCTAAVAIFCPILPSAVPATPASITVRTGFGGQAAVRSALIPAGSRGRSPLSAPIEQPVLMLPVVNGTVTIATPSLQDGDAVELTITGA